MTSRIVLTNLLTAEALVALHSSLFASPHQRPSRPAGAADGDNNAMPKALVGQLSNRISAWTIPALGCPNQPPS